MSKNKKQVVKTLNKVIDVTSIPEQKDILSKEIEIQQKIQAVTVGDVWDSEEFSLEVRRVLVKSVKDYQESCKKASLFSNQIKSTPFGRLLNGGYLEPELFIETYKQICSKVSDLPRSQRDVVLSIGNYAQTLAIQKIFEKIKKG